MVRRIAFALVSVIGLASTVAAQAPDPVVTEPAVTEPAAPSGAPRTMIGTWEFSNADRERTCVITFRSETGRSGKRVEFDPGCAAKFPFTREIVAWNQDDNDFLRLLDGQGKSVLEFSEVESGIFEAPRAGEGILFIQNPAALGPAPRTAEQMTGEWQMARGNGRPLCALTLSNVAAGEEFVVRVPAQCDATVRRFGPATWLMDRGELVLRSAGGQTWRFEEIEGAKWRRVPETSDPLMMVKK